MAMKEADEDDILDDDDKDDKLESVSLRISCCLLIFFKHMLISYTTCISF